MKEEPRKLFELFEQGTIADIRLSPKQNQEYGKLDTHHTSNFIYIAWMIYIMPIYAHEISTKENVAGFLILESHFLICIIVYSMLYKYYSENAILTNKPEFKFLKYLLTYICLSTLLDCLRFKASFNEFVSIFHKSPLLYGYTNTYLFVTFIFLISYNYSLAISDISISIVYTLALSSSTQSIMLVSKFRIFLMYMNLLILIPEIFKFLSKTNPAFRYAQILLCFIFNTAVQTLTDSQSRLTLEFAVFFLVMSILYPILFNTCFYYRKERLKGKWDLPFVVNYY